MSNNQKSINNSDKHFALKVVVIGDAAVGKSTLLERYINDTFNEDEYSYQSTIGVDFKIKILDIESNPINHDSKKLSHSYKLQIWDTAGQERFSSITQSYYRGTDIFIICFDISLFSGQGSMYSVIKWIRDIELNCESEIPSIYVIGTRIDKILHHEYKNVTDDAELLRCVETWEACSKYKNVKFMGLCSSKKDRFIPHEHINGSLNTMIDTDQQNSIINTSKQLSIDTMFIEITKDHVTNKFRKIHTQDRHKEQLIILPEVEKTLCCAIL